MGVVGGAETGFCFTFFAALGAFRLALTSVRAKVQCKKEGKKK